jgi:dihydrofolate reductase
MGKVILDMAMSLDGFIAGPNDEYLGLYDWFFSPSGGSARVVDESVNMTGAILIGRRTYDLADKVDGFVDTPYKAPNFVLSHNIPEKAAKGETVFIFVTQGIESALEQAKTAAGDKNVAIGGGANTAQQYINAGLLDEMQIHLVHVLAGDGIRLFDHTGMKHIELERTRVIEGQGVTHLRFRIVKLDK